MDFLKNKLMELNQDKKEDIILEENHEKVYSKYEQAERYLIYYMLKNKEVIKVYNNKITYMPDEKYRILAREIVSYYKINGIINTADLITELLKSNKELVKVIGDIEASGYKDEYNLDEINDYINVIKEYNIKNELNRIKKEMKQEPDPIKRAEIAQKIVELKMRGEEENDKWN